MDIRLSSAMATSAAAVSHDLGDYEASQLLGFRELRVVLGLGYALFPRMIFFKLRERPFKIPSNVLTRWCIINILHVRLLRILLGVTNVGPVPPPFMSLSDGAHVENLGLLPLLKQRLSRIIVVNGGALESGTYATDLLLTLQQARVKLRCSFTGVSGRDIHEDIRQEFVEKPSGNQPRSYRFKVTYYEKSGFEEKVVGEGEVILLMPRHPDDGISQFEDCKWIDLDDDVKLDLDESAWGPGPYLKASEVDRLTGCCCECCHCTPLCCVHNPLCGRFPFHSIVNQMFTASQFNAYHREGYRACLEAEADEFLGTHENEDEVVVDQPQVSPVTAKTIHVANID
ncbi:hypothetical protein QZH41_000165 [Actinostola sp. cb2023]|nr:hypothetical protein QZH41_000165 [Actinostola sp. cb2023]